MAFQIIWFILWGVLWAVYFMLDGFDFGAGMLYNFLSSDEKEKRIIARTIGPVWNGNEVWLLTAGGATFAAFPTTYALMFSYLYSALLLVLFSLIVRGVSLEFREKSDNPGWKKGWDIGIFLGSFLPSLLFGVAFGNIFQGLPMDENGYHGSLLSLLNPYGLLTGALFVLLFLEHGSVWLSVKASNGLAEKAAGLARKIWVALLVVAVVFLVYTYFATNLYANYLNNPILLVVPVVAVASLLLVRVFAAKAGNYLKAFFSSCITIVAVTFTGVIGLFPNLIPSTLSPAHSLTIYNSSSSVYTLKIMTVVALIFVPVVIAYQIWTYNVFRHRTTAQDVSGHQGEVY